jgi:hypothetical protein
MIEYDNLPPREQTKKYRELAEDARRMAEKAQDSAVRVSYAIIADRWEAKADEIENELIRRQGK